MTDEEWKRDVRNLLARRTKVICELAEAKTIEERDAVMDRAIAAEKAAGDIAQAEVNWLRLGWELPRA